MNDIMISIHPEYVQKILSGEKTIELRRRAINIPPKTKIWIYSTRPCGKIIANALLKKIEVMSPANAWKTHQKAMCIKKESYKNYTESLDFVYLFHLINIKRMRKNISLEEMRSCCSKFHPPQFFMHLSDMNVKSLLMINE